MKGWGSCMGPPVTSILSTGRITFTFTVRISDSDRKFICIKAICLTPRTLHMNDISPTFQTHWFKALLEFLDHAVVRRILDQDIAFSRIVAKS